MILTILVFLLMLSVLVLIHEAGHFFAAKKFGVKVEEFGFGFPPRALSIKKGETIYSINWLPIGGFVKLYGEDDAGAGKISLQNPSQHISKSDKHRAFFVKPLWQRGIIITAGVVMNFLLAVSILTYLFIIPGIPQVISGVKILGIAKHSPAEKAQLRVGDVVLKINNNQIIAPEDLMVKTKEYKGKPMHLVVQKGNSVQRVTIIPRIKYPKNEGAMGVAIGANVIVKKYPWYQAPFMAVIEAGKEVGMVLSGLGTTVTNLIVNQQVPKDIAGPVGIAQLTGQFMQIGPTAVLSLASLLSINLAVLNILPIPALDGGRLFFIIIEAITRKKVHPKFEMYAHTIGMIVLITLIAVITFHDISRVVQGKPLLPQP